MDQKQLVKKLLMEAFLPKPHLDQNQNILQELVNFYEIFEEGQCVYLNFPEAALEHLISFWTLFSWSILFKIY